MFQQSGPIASVIGTEELFGASSSISDAIFWKAKIYKTFVDFCFPKIASEIDAEAPKSSSVPITNAIGPDYWTHYIF